MTSVTPIFFKNTENRPSMGVSEKNPLPSWKKSGYFLGKGTRALKFPIS